MPYLRLSSLPLDDPTKRYLADELTATVLDILPDAKPEWTTVHFTAFEPENFAVAGRLVADGGIPDTHLEISAPGVDEKSWFALRNRLTDVLIEALAIPENDRWHVNVKLNPYDRHSFAIAGNATDELEFGDGEPGNVPAGGTADSYREGTGKYGPRRRPPWRMLALGFLAGTALAFRWLTKRIGSDAIVDAAPPPSSTDATAPLGTREARSSAEAAPY